MRRLFLSLFFLIFLGLSLTQASAQTTAFYGEAGGQGVFFSMNYDRRLMRTTQGLGLRIGVGYGVSVDPTYWTIPVGVYWLDGDRGNFFEAGAGATYVSLSNVPAGGKTTFGNTDWYGNQKFLFATLNIGYRRQPRTGHLNFRTGLTPMFGRAVMMIPYLSVGYNF
jgi:hypothetical protein